MTTEANTPTPTAPSGPKADIARDWYRDLVDQATRRKLEPAEAKLLRDCAAFLHLADDTIRADLQAAAERAASAEANTTTTPEACA